MLPEIEKGELARVLDGCVEQLLWEAEVTRPPIDAFLVARRLGIAIVESGETHQRASLILTMDTVQVALSDKSQQDSTDTPRQLRGAVLLGDESRLERRQWSVAHEIGEAHAYRVFDQLAVDPREAPATTREQVANSLAARLLMPTRWAIADGRLADWDLYELKTLYSTASNELIARRMLDLIPQPIVVSLFDQGTTTWRLSNFGGQRILLCGEERVAWRHAHEEEEPAVADRFSGPTQFENFRADLQRIRCWPVHEPDWRREIMLTEFMDNLH